MSTTQQISRIAALVAQLNPLGGKSRGMRIEADEWNALVNVVGGGLDVQKQLEDSLQLELEGEFAHKVHRHTGEISLESLDPELQARIGGNGSGGGITTRIALTDVQSKVDALGSEVSRVTAATDEIQHQLDTAVADTLARTTKLDGFEDRFRGIEDLRGLVAALTAQVSGLSEGIEAVLQLRGNLKDVDVGALQQRVSTLETFTDNLNGVDGRPVRLVDVEVDIRELQNALDLKPGGIDDRFKGLREELSTNVDTRVEAGLAGARNDLQAQISGLKGDLSTEFDGKVDGARTTLEASLDGKLADTQSTLDASFTTRLDAATSALGDTLTGVAGSLVDDRLAGLPAQIQAGVSAAAPGLQEQLLSALGEQLNAQTGALETQLTERTDALATQFAQQAAQLPSLVADYAGELLPGLVDQRIGATSEQLATALGARIDQQLTAARNAIAIAIQTQVGEQIGGALGEVDGRISEQLKAQLADLDSRIESATANALEGLPDQVGREVGSQLDRLELDGRMTQLEKQLSTSFEKFSANMADLQAQTKADLEATNEGLRSEIAAARDTAIREAADMLDRTATDLRQQIKDIIGGTRDQLTAVQATFAEQLQKTVDVAVAQVETDLTAATAKVLDEAQASVAAMRDSITADFGAELDKTQTTLVAQITSANQATLSKANAAVAQLSKTLTPRLDQLELKIVPVKPGATTVISPINPIITRPG